MKLSMYPRPKGDNGRGMHWSPSTVHPDGKELHHWIDQLLKLGVKWVKLLDDGLGSSLAVCRLLIQNDMMPVVRPFRSPQYPSSMGKRHEEAIRQLIDAGVAYFEIGNEPDMPAEWVDGRLPRDWLHVAASQFIHEADVVLALGGLPGLPALSSGNSANLIDQVVRAGRADLFSRGAWVAVHNYTLNHPLDYPLDPVNQEGVPVSRAEYDQMGSWSWDEQPRQMINIWRRQEMQPGQSIEESSDCWRAFELANRMVEEALGFNVPIISTEGGAVVGWRDDRRYPRVTPDLHAEWSVSINQYMQTEAPSYFFATCHWLLGNFHMGHHVMGWESQAWFTDWWENTFDLKGHLPAVDAVRNMPNLERKITLAESEVRGSLTDPTGEGLFGVAVSLLAGNKVVATTSTNARGRFRFSDLPGGDYTLKVENSSQHERISLDAGASASVHLALSQGKRSAILGRVTTVEGQPASNQVVQLETAGNRRQTLTHTSTDDNGSFSFSGLHAGSYRLSAGSGFISGIRLDGWRKWEGSLTLPPSDTMRYVVLSNRLLTPEENAGQHLFFGKVLDQTGKPLDGVQVEMSWVDAAPGTRFPVVLTGQDREKPAGYFEFVNTPGVFQLRILDPGIESEVAGNLSTLNLNDRPPGPVSYEVVFERRRMPAHGRFSSVEVSLPGCPEGLSLSLRDERGGPPLEGNSKEGTRVIFENLPAGRYWADLAGIRLTESIEIDGYNPGYLHATLGGTIHVEISPRASAGRLKLTTSQGGFIDQREAEPGESLCFGSLPSGDYLVHYLGWRSEPIHLEADGTAFVQGVDSQRSHEASLEGRLLSAQGETLPGRQVILMASGDIRGIQPTDSRGRYSFAGLSAGSYALVVEAAGTLQEEIHLEDGDSRLVDLRIPEEADTRLIEHYLLLPGRSVPGPWITLLLLRDFIARFQPTVGFDPREAEAARRVTIVADRSTIGLEVENRLLGAGCLVERLPGESYDLAEAVKRVLSEDRQI